MTGQIIPLPSTVALLASGPQAADLLQAQLTQDLRKLSPEHALPAAYCTPQGRMLADFVLVPRVDGSIVLLLDASLLEAALKRLRMFILRLQCRLDPLPQVIHGVLMPSTETLATELPQQPWSITRHAGVDIVRLPDAPNQRRLLLLGVDAAPALPAWAQSCSPAAEDAWQLAAIRAGQPGLSAPTSGQFVPQMLNLDLLGAIDFKKGCYPGQEVVARTAYRGTIKRRCYRLGSRVPLQAGDEVFDTTDPGQPCGMVVNAAPAANGWEALVELKIDAANADRLRLASADGAALQLLELPYTLDPLP